jgi:hypothetical protein
VIEVRFGFGKERLLEGERGEDRARKWERS